VYISGGMPVANGSTCLYFRKIPHSVVTIQCTTVVVKLASCQRLWKTPGKLTSLLGSLKASVVAYWVPLRFYTFVLQMLASLLCRGFEAVENVTGT
jgi:hypothetical protein